MATSTIPYGAFSVKHKRYIKNAIKCKMSVAEGSIRSGKTIDNCIVAAMYLETCPDKFHLASGSSLANAKLNIGTCNGFGLENLFRGRCKWGKYQDNECLKISTQTGLKIVIFAGGGLANSYKKILGNSYGLWIATEINEHYDSDNSKESFIKVAMGRQVAAIQPKILWDLNPCSQNNPIYSQYIDKYKDTFIGGYNYEHFTLHDNINISKQRMEEIASQYDFGSVWYRRDILGERCSPEGLVYQVIANHPEEYIVERLPKDITKVVIGVDFGGNNSYHAFVCVGFTRQLKEVLVIKSERIDASGTDADYLGKKYVEFANSIYERLGLGMTCYCDSAEQVLINTMRKWAYSNNCHTIIENARKSPVNDRIRSICTLATQKRIKFLKYETESVMSAICEAKWDGKEAEKGNDVRLDNGTTDIDSCDAFEYSIERDIKNLIRTSNNTVLD